MIDWIRVKQLQDEIGCADFDEIVVIFLEEVDETIGRLSAGFDPETLATDFHFLKGSALNLGFRDVAALCQEGESAPRNPDADTALVTKMVETYRLSRETFLSTLEDPLKQTG